MRISSFLALLLSAVIAPSVIGASLSRRQNLQKALQSAIKKTIPGALSTTCKEACGKKCPLASIVMTGLPLLSKVVCHVGCKRICKRSISILGDSQAQYYVIPFSGKFHHYDLSGDSFITPDEFASVESVPVVEVRDLFFPANKNGDGKLNAEEFKAAPFIFSKKVADELNVLNVVENEHGTSISSVE